MKELKEEWFNDKEYFNIVKDLIENPEFKKLGNYIHHHFTDRLEHSIDVSYKSYKIAKNNNLDYKSVARGALLHDFYLMTTKEVASLSMGSHNNLHPKLALENAKKITSLNDIEEDIILKHMFAVSLSRPPRFKESMLVSLVDKYVSLEEVSKPLFILLRYHLARATYILSY